MDSDGMRGRRLRSCRRFFALRRRKKSSNAAAATHITPSRMAAMSTAAHTGMRSPLPPLSMLRLAGSPSGAGPATCAVSRSSGSASASACSAAPRAAGQEGPHQPVVLVYVATTVRAGGCAMFMGKRTTMAVTASSAAPSRTSGPNVNWKPALPPHATWPASLFSITCTPAAASPSSPVAARFQAALVPTSCQPMR